MGIAYVDQNGFLLFVIPNTNKGLSNNTVGKDIYYRQHMCHLHRGWGAGGHLGMVWLSCAAPPWGAVAVGGTVKPIFHRKLGSRWVQTQMKSTQKT